MKIISFDYPVNTQSKKQYTEMLHLDLGNSKVKVITEIKFSCVKLILLVCVILRVEVTKKIRFPFETGFQTLK